MVAASLGLALATGGVGIAVVAGATHHPEGAERVVKGAATGVRRTAPGSLRETGLYADWERRQIDARNLAFVPQYPLWTDGATKRRWIRIPAGAAIDAAWVDAWEFPVGTRLWKEFSFGRPVETRYMERTADGWLFAAYVWKANGSDATLAPEAGVPASVEIAPGTSHAIPGEIDCRTCHDAAAPVLGFSALQLSSDRDPRALHAEPSAQGAVDLRNLVERGLIENLPARFMRQPPRIAARDATERAALGYLHGNCGGCHNPRTSLGTLGLTLSYELEEPALDAIATTFDRASRFLPPGLSPEAGALRVAPGAPESSVLLARIRSRSPSVQMPPLGTQVVDERAARLIETWIREAPARAADRIARQPQPRRGDRP